MGVSTVFSFLETLSVAVRDRLFSSWREKEEWGG